MWRREMCREWLIIEGRVKGIWEIGDWSNIIYYLLKARSEWEGRSWRCRKRDSKLDLSRLYFVGYVKER